MLHVLAHNGHCGQSLLSTHGIHGTLLYLLGKLRIEHTAGFLGVLISHTYARTVLRGCLADQEHADAIVGQTGEDATVDTYDAHHGQTCHCDECGALDAGDSLDDAGVGLNLILDNGTGSIGIEGILDEYGDMLDTHGIDGGRIYHLGTEVAEFHSLHITEFGNHIGCTDDTWVGRHEAIHIGPYLQHTGIQYCSDDAGCVVATASAQIGHLTAYGIGADKSAHQTHLGNRLPVLLHQARRKVHGQAILSSLDLSLDESTAVIPLGVLHQVGHDATADALSIRDYGCQRLGAKVTNQIYTLIDAAELLQEVMHDSQQRLPDIAVSNDSVDHILMPLSYLPERFLIQGVTFHCHLGCSYQLIGDTSQGTYNHDDRLLLSLYNSLYTQDTVYGTYRCPAKL